MHMLKHKSQTIYIQTKNKRELKLEVNTLPELFATLFADYPIGLVVAYFLPIVRGIRPLVAAISCRVTGCRPYCTGSRIWITGLPSSAPVLVVCIVNWKID